MLRSGLSLQRALLLLFAAFHAGANADPLLNRLRDEYTADKPWRMSLRTITLGTSERAVAAEIIIANPGCTGSFSGIGSSDGERVQLRAYKPALPDEQACVIDVRLDKTGKVATISGRDCSYFHGARCDFSGQLVAR